MADKFLPSQYFSWKFFRWFGRRWLERAGLATLVSAGIAIACCFLVIYELHPLMVKIDTLSAQKALARPRLRARPEQVTVDVHADLSRFYGLMPPSSEIFALMERLHRAAASQSISLDRGEYQFVPVADTHLLRYDVELPVHGGYVQIRRFIAQAQSDIPSLAMKEMSFVRQKIDEPVVEARIRMTLYVRQDNE